MTEPVIAPAVADKLCPAFGLLSDPLEFIDRDSSRWHPFALQAEPPVEVAHLHDPYRFARLWERLLAVMRNPVQEQRSGDTRYVQVVGAMVITVEADGTLHPHAWLNETLGARNLEPLDEWESALQGMPFGDMWLRMLARQAALEIQYVAKRQGLALSMRRACRYANWAFGCFERQLRRHADLRLMRRRIAHALGIDPRLVALAARMPRTTMPAGVVTVGAYNRVLRHRAAFESLALEAPNLVQVYAALCDRPLFEAEGEPVACLRQYLTARLDITATTWRMIAKSDGRLLQPLTEFYCGDPTRAAVEHLGFLDGLGLRKPAPAWLIRAMLATWGDEGNRWTSYYSDLDRHGKLWRHVVSLIKHRVEPDAQLLHELDMVQRWITARRPALVLDKLQRAAGWPWLVREASAWAERRERELRDGNECWPAPFDFAHVEDCALIPLRNPFELWEEALAMRHCVDTFGERCRAGTSLILSVRRGDRRIATAELKHGEGMWRLHQVKGFANKAAPRQLVEELQRWTFTLAPMPDPTEDEINQVEGPEQVENDGDGCDGNKLNDEAIAWIVDGRRDENDGALERRVTQMLDRLNDAGELSYEYNGQIVLHHQLENWRLDPLAWLEQAEVAGLIDAVRLEQLSIAEDTIEAMRPDEINAVCELFVTETLSGDGTDADVYGVWGAERLEGSDGRSVWAVYRITGYSFTILELELLGLCDGPEKVYELLASCGRYSGDVPATESAP